MDDFPKGWEDVVKIMKAEWIDNDVTRELSRRVSDSDIAIVIWGCMKDDSLPWLDYKMPAAGRNKPIDLLKSKKGKAEIRWILISNPWWPAMGKRNESE
ncbi:hypothetical protein [Burkholderia sp. Tr-20390]|uniref:hypothetical protein n=1 Tax=Burkholderia sp. Tr-20390 TaxID=2703904 RepID=UPI0019811EEA|nr:hypothetical protein [Burkholderia sp. Tr-20390]MBN3730565.1 hypothetical protein [Burkholderia sp. Tr-20390]